MRKGVADPLQNGHELEDSESSANIYFDLVNSELDSQFQYINSLGGPTLVYGVGSSQ